MTQHPIASSTPIPEGDRPTEEIRRLVGAFEILDFLGRGGMGEVFRARQRTLGREVALKVMNPGKSSNPLYVARFVREARAAAALDHPNIVGVIDAGVDDKSGVPYIAFAYVDGENLHQLVGRRGRLADRDALEIALAVARALDCAHERGFIHRDIKPENILISREGAVKLTDLGLAKHEDEAQSLTQTGSFLGTPHYVSPEQANGDELDIRTDLYSLGIVLYEMVTGRAPFGNDGPIAIIARRLAQDCPDPRDAVPTVGEAVARIVSNLAARDLDGRYATPAEAVAAIERALEGSEARAARRPAVAVAPKGRTGSSQGSLVAAAAVAGGLAVAAVAVLITSGPKDLAGRSEGTGSNHARAGDRVEPPEEPPPEPAEPAWRDQPVAFPRGAAFVRGDGIELTDVLGHAPFRVPAMGINADLSTDGTRVFAAGLDGTLVVWDAATGRELFHRMVDLRGERLTAASATGDGLFAFAGMPDGSVLVFDVDRGATATIEASADPITAVAAAPKADRIAIATGGGAIEVSDLVRDPPSFRPVRKWRVESEVTEAALSADGRRLVTSRQDGVAQMWDVASGDELWRAEIVSKTRVAPTVATNADASMILAAPIRQPGQPLDGKRTRLWDRGRSDDPASFVTLSGDGDACRGVALDRSGARALTGSQAGPVFLWDTSDLGQPLARFDAHQSWVQAVSLSPDGERGLSLGNDGIVRRWDLRTRVEIPLPPARGHLGPVHTATRLADRALLTAGARQLCLWSGTPDPTPLALGARITSLASTADPARVVVATGEGRVIAVDLADRKAIEMHAGHADEATKLGGSWVRRAHVAALATTPDGRSIASASDLGRLCFWRTGTLNAFPVAPPIDALAFLPDGRLVSLAFDGARLTLHGAADGAAVESHELGARAGALATSPAGDVIAIALTDGSIQIVPPTDAGAPSAVLTGHRPRSDEPQRIAFGDALIATSAGSVVEVWLVATGQRIARTDLTPTGYGVTALTIHETPSGPARAVVHAGTSSGRVIVLEVARP